MGGRLRGMIWMIAGLILAGLAAIIAFVMLSTVESRQAPTGEGTPRVPVLVAARVVEIGSALAADDVEVKQYPVDLIPEGAVTEPEQAVGKLTLVDLEPGEIILEQRLVDPNIVSADGRRALLVAEEEVLMAYPADDLLTTKDVLRPGDRVDILITLDFPTNRGLAGVAGGAAGTTTTGAGGAGAAQQDEPATFIVLQNVGIAGLVGRQAPQAQGGAAGPLPGGAQAQGPVQGPQAILFTLKPQDALTLKFAMDSDGIQDIVLRAPGMDRPFETDPVDIDYVIRRYSIPTEVGR